MPLAVVRFFVVNAAPKRWGEGKGSGHRFFSVGLPIACSYPLKVFW